MVPNTPANLDWKTVNQRLIAKAIRELVFEEAMSVIDHQGAFILKTPNGNYRFSGKQGIWGDLRVQSESLSKEGQPVLAADFFCDTQEFTKMTDITLANFLEEMHNSLYADLKILKLNKDTDVAKISKLDGEQIQYFLTGHPKIINNKGRIGWSASEQDLFAPENQNQIQFSWLGIQKEYLTTSISDQLNWDDIYKQSLSEQEIKEFSKKIDLSKYRLVPVHPWQWERYIKIQFLDDLYQKKIIFLGSAGDFYKPQISLRTFSNVSRPGLADLKLPLTILNTSSFRGIPSRYIQEGAELSRDFESICQSDTLLNKSNVRILKELAGASIEQGSFLKIKAAPYRYHELLGAVWRESALKVRTAENSLMTGALLYEDQNGQSLAAEYIKLSGLSPTQWLSSYARSVVIPLFHLQLKYGIGIVSHGQNIVLQLRDFKPVGLILKDFQGDLRLSEKSTALKQKVQRLPAHYLIHDLITGHFVTNLRYLSGVLEDHGIISEIQFYAAIGDEIRKYYQKNDLTPESPQVSSLNLLAPSFKKVLINAVRFKVGYQDSMERPVPILGKDLINPFFNRVVQNKVML